MSVELFIQKEGTRTGAVCVHTAQHLVFVRNQRVGTVLGGWAVSALQTFPFGWGAVGLRAAGSSL